MDFYNNFVKPKQIKTSENLFNLFKLCFSIRSFLLIEFCDLCAISAQLVIFL